LKHRNEFEFGRWGYWLLWDTHTNHERVLLLWLLVPSTAILLCLLGSAGQTEIE
jgi:hypothetical protein